MKKNNILEKNHDLCTGCGICEGVCPVDAIKIIKNEDGFYTPEIDNFLCIECGICKKSCYKFEDNFIKSNTCIKSYSGKNIDLKILKNSTSGGISYELMKLCIDEGYKIVGVGYDYKEHIAKTYITQNKDELEIFLGSKYMQSFTVDAYKDMLNNKELKYAIFGTPCQIYAIKKYAENNNLLDKFLFVDLFCHGCPSLNLWTKYLNKIRKKFKSNINFINFRSKIYGWHEQAFLFKTENQYIKSNKSKNEFNEIFYNLDALNRACYNCNLRSSLYYTDIRLGDYWGIKYNEDIEGVSAIIAVTTQGNYMLNKISKTINLKEECIEEILKGQSYGKIHVINEKRRNRILELLKDNNNIEKNYKEYVLLFSLKDRIKFKIKSLLKMLPQNYINSIRKYIHKIKK
ncbi:Coenzyme F420 hydrogenase/dehydrogenase, beta subunit C-terminal domain [Cetobacterium sp. SF1]|uniref:Coenzyme F420 hydrogenase/dehydrogenase, beta subunit C-terminal domain n=1 Tax=Cetobacterium sp. SF1 TaxID=3417654 RepID=UPI003CF31C1C